MSVLDELLANRIRAAAQIASDSGVDDLANTLNQSADRQEYGDDGWTPDEIFNSSFNPSYNPDYYQQPIISEQQSAENQQPEQQRVNDNLLQGFNVSNSLIQNQENGKRDDVQKGQNTPQANIVSQAINSNHDLSRLTNNTPEKTSLVSSKKPDTIDNVANQLEFSNTKLENSNQESFEERDRDIQQIVRNSVSDILNSGSKENTLSTENVKQDNRGENNTRLSFVNRPRSVVANTGSENADGIIKDIVDENDNALNPSIERNTQAAQDNDNYQSRLNNLQQLMHDEQQQRENLEKEIERNYLLSQYGQLGIGPDNQFLQDAFDRADSGEVSSVAKEIARRVTDNNGNIETNPLNWNILGFSSQNKSSDNVSDLYNTWFNSKQYQAAELERARNPYVPLDNNSLLDRTMIDDGSSPFSREGIYMTGDQYLRYRNELGIPGRDVNEIIPDRLYSKQDEMNNYGFIPYITSDSGLDKFHNEASAQTLNNTFNDFTNLRRDNSDFSVNVDGRSYSGRDIVKKMDSQGETIRKQISDIRNDPNNYEFSQNPDDAGEYSIPIDGVKNNLTGEVKTGVSFNQIVKNDDNSVTLPDGTVWSFKDDNELKNNVTWDISDDNSNAIAWLNLKPGSFDSVDKVKLSNGDTIDGITAMNIMEQISNGDSKNIDYGQFNWGNPNISLPENMLDLQQWGDFIGGGKYAPWFADMVLSSAPFFYLPIGGARGASRAWTELGGISPDKDRYNGSYSLLSENPTLNQEITQAVGSATMPLTEQLWGPLGAKFLGHVFPKKLGEDVVKTWSPAKRYLSGTLGEALEEIPGNLTEELERSGWKDFYADEIPNEYDDQGRQKRANTDFLGRLINFAKDIPEALIGGASLGGVLGLGALPEYISDYNKHKSQIMKYGDSLNESESQQGRRLTDEERAYYNG